MPDFADRFWSHVNKENDCWEWLACKNNKGYGRFQVKGKARGAHRVSWELCNEREIPSGMLVLHLCDNPSCVNPAHLDIGTQKENVQDCMKKGRKKMKGEDNYFHKNPRIGALNGRCKLTTEQVKEIRLHKEIVSQYELGKKYGVSQSLIGSIQRREIWNHL